MKVHGILAVCAILAAMAVCSTSQAGVSVGIGIGVPAYPYPYYHHHYYPYGYRVYVAPPPYTTCRPPRTTMPRRRHISRLPRVCATSPTRGAAAIQYEFALCPAGGSSHCPRADLRTLDPPAAAGPSPRDGGEFLAVTRVFCLWSAAACRRFPKRRFRVARQR